MENRQRTIRKLLWRITAVLAILAVVSICFVSGTFARYVTKKSGSFDSVVALWKITEEVTDGDGQLYVNLEKISPSKSPADIKEEGADDNKTYSLNTQRSKKLADITVKIKNEGDVDAYVKLTLDTAFSGYLYDFKNGNIQMEGGSRKVKDNAYTFPSNEDPDEPNIPTSKEWEAIFTAEWGKVQITRLTEDGQSGTPEDATAVNEGDYKDMYLVKPRETLSVAVTIKWNTDLVGDTVSPDGAGCIDADYRDTWIGENIGKISLAYSWYAVQGSEMPAENTQGN